MLTNVSETTFGGPCVFAWGDRQYFKFKEGRGLASGIAVSFTPTGDILVKPDGPVAPEDCDPRNCPFFVRCDRKGLRLSRAESQSPDGSHQHSPGFETPTPSISMISPSPNSTPGSPTAPSSPPSLISHLLPKFPNASRFFVRASDVPSGSSSCRSAHEPKAEPGFGSDCELD